MMTSTTAAPIDGNKNDDAHRHTDALDGLVRAIASRGAELASRASVYQSFLCAHLRRLCFLYKAYRLGPDEGKRAKLIVSAMLILMMSISLSCILALLAPLCLRRRCLYNVAQASDARHAQRKPWSWQIVMLVGTRVVPREGIGSSV